MLFNIKDRNYGKMKADKNISSEDYVLNMYISALGLMQQMPFSSWLQATEIYYLIVLEAISTKSRCRQSHSFQKFRGESFLDSSTSWQLLEFLSFMNLYPHFPRLLSLCLSVSIFSVSGQHSLELGPTLNLGHLYLDILKKLHLPRCCFQIKSHSKIPGGHELLQNTIQSNRGDKKLEVIF